MKKNIIREDTGILENTGIPENTDDNIPRIIKKKTDNILSDNFDWKIEVGSKFKIPILGKDVIVTKIYNSRIITKVFLTYNNTPIWWYVLNEEWNNIMSKYYKKIDKVVFIVDYFKDKKEQIFFVKDINGEDIWWVGEKAFENDK